MKITVTQEFENIEDAQAFLGKLAVAPDQVAKPAAASVATAPSGAATGAPDATATGQRHTEHGGGATASTPQPPAPRTRKPRNDAGKPRGPYKTGTEPNANAGGAGAPAANPSGAPAGQQAATPAAALTDAEKEKAVRDAEAYKADDAARTALQASRDTAAAAPGAELTQDDARAALRRINDTKGLGTPACIAHLQDFGVNQLSLLPKEKYALFIKQADEKVAEFLAAKK